MKNVILMILVLMIGGEALACPVNYEDLLISPKGLKIFRGKNLGIDQSDFFDAIDLVQKKYEPRFTELGLRLEMIVDWNNDSKNMYSGSRGSQRIISVSGGLARLEIMKKDSFILALCHEVGHHLGGLPKINKDHWASAEGQSDYFAALECMKEVLEDSQKVKAPKIVLEKCQNEVCVRTSVAGKVIGSLDDYLNLNGKIADIDWSRPEANVVTDTITDYPSGQCRLDTFFLGAQGAPRPSCWFAK